MSTSPISLPSTPASLMNPASSSSSSSSQASAQSAIDALGNPDTFLQLLVAQLQYQDPTSPADGTTFVTQLATFAGVEEQSAMRTDLDSMNTVAQTFSGGPAAVASAIAADTGSSTDTKTTGATGTTGSN